MRSSSVPYRRETRRERTFSRSRNVRNGFVEAAPVRLQWVTVRHKTDTYSSRCCCCYLFVSLALQPIVVVFSQPGSGF